jgi:hypothetical protein
MPHRVQLVLSDFMDAVVIVDPVGYQRQPEEPERPLRTLPFGAGWRGTNGLALSVRGWMERAAGVRRRFRGNVLASAHPS